jgi:hypothetical protein
MNMPIGGERAPAGWSAGGVEAGGWTVRRLLLVLVHVGILGLLAELFLLGHTESATQWIPLVALAVGLASAVAVALRATPARLRAFQGVMALFVIAGLLGLVLHYRGNVEFELERDASLSGLKLFWESLRGATPTLAPGALFQLGLLGLAYTFRHPALARRR